MVCASRVNEHVIFSPTFEYYKSARKMGVVITNKKRIVWPKTRMVSAEYTGITSTFCHNKWNTDTLQHTWHWTEVLKLGYHCIVSTKEGEGCPFSRERNGDCVLRFTWRLISNKNVPQNYLFSVYKISFLRFSSLSLLPFSCMKKSLVKKRLWNINSCFSAWRSSYFSERINKQE